MFFLNDEDLLLIKYMILAFFDGTNINKDNLKKTKNFDQLKLFFKEEDINEIIVDNFFKEALFHANCFNILHLQDGCPKNFEKSEWGNDIGDEIILFVRLFQKLDVDDFANMLESCTNTTLEEFLYLEFDLECLNAKIYISEIITWLENHNNIFAEDVKRMLELRKMNKYSIAEKTKDRTIADSNNNQKGNSIDSLLTKDFPPPDTDKIKGICLVISNEIFEEKDEKGKNLSIRNGTLKDEVNIWNTFKPLGYDIKIYRNVDYQSLKGIIENTKQEIKSTHRLLMTFILSHGKEKCFFTTDNKEVTFEEMWKPFSNENFIKFIGRAKLFFFVCCQGDELNAAIKVPPNSNIESDCPSTPKSYCPAMADFFFGYATFESYLSCRTAKTGTYYVDCLCQVVSEFPKESIAAIHQEVQTRLSQALVSIKNKGRGFQMPYYINILTDPISFVDSDDE